MNRHTLISYSHMIRVRLQRHRSITKALVILVLVGMVAGIAPRPAAATDFGGDQSGKTLTTADAPDNLFTFLSDITGSFTVVGINNTEIDFWTLGVGITLDLTNEATAQTIAGASILFQGFNTAGNTYFVGGTANDDTLIGGDGNDTLIGGDGNNTISGGAGDDTLYGWAGNDSISGGDGNDYIEGGAGDDTLYGEDGDDELHGDDGNDLLYGGDGTDSMSGQAGDDTLDGGDGTDTFFAITGSDMTVNLVTQTATGDGTDTLASIENAVTWSGNDTLIGDSNDNRLRGYGGNDTIIGGGGNDTIIGGAGADTIDGGAGTDIQSEVTPSDCVGDTVSNVETDNCPAVVPPVPAPSVEAPKSLTPDLCITRGTRMAYQSDRNLIVVYSDFEDANPNGMIITEIPLGVIPTLTDEQKASGQPIPLLYKDSEFAPRWSVGLYWHNNHYGVQIFNDGHMFDDTGAICGWF